MSGRTNKQVDRTGREGEVVQNRKGLWRIYWNTHICCRFIPNNDRRHASTWFPDTLLCCNVIKLQLHMVTPGPGEEVGDGGEGREKEGDKSCFCYIFDIEKLHKLVWPLGVTRQIPVGCSVCMIEDKPSLFHSKWGNEIFTDPIIPLKYIFKCMRI